MNERQSRVRALWLSMARSSGFALAAALLCRVFAPTFRPGPVSVPLAPALSTPRPRATSAPRPTPSPAPPPAERKRRARVDEIIAALQDFDSYTNDARIYNKKTDDYRYDRRIVARVERRVKARIARLRRAGADLNGAGSEGRTPLTSASAIEGNPFPLRLILRLGADVNRRDANHETALEATFVEGETTYFNIDIARELLRAGADPNARLSTGATPLIAALNLDYRNRPALELLLRAGAKVNLPGAEGETPLMAAAEGGEGFEPDSGAPMHPETWALQRLLSAGAQIGARDTRGQTVLMHAVAYSHEIDDYEDSDSETPRTRTAHTGVYNLPALRILLARGADVNARDNQGQSALHLANQFDTQADSSYEDHEINKRLRTIRALLDGAADVNARDKRGRTPLMNALETYYGSSLEAGAALLPVRLLLERGANPNARDTAGRSVLDLARREPNVTKLLRAHGAR